MLGHIRSLLRAISRYNYSCIDLAKLKNEAPATKFTQ